MSTRLLAASWREVRPVLLWQLAGIAVLTGVFAAALGAKAGWSALVGSGIGCLGIAYLMVALLKSSLRPGVMGSMAGIFASWLIKAALTLGLLGIALRLQALPLPLLAGLGGSMAAYWLAMSFAGMHRRSGRDGG